MRQHRRYIEDPSIARCAALEFDRVWGLIERSTADGEWFFRAREVVLGSRDPRHADGLRPGGGVSRLHSDPVSGPGRHVARGEAHSPGPDSRPPDGGARAPARRHRHHQPHQLPSHGNGILVNGQPGLVLADRVGSQAVSWRLRLNVEAQALRRAAGLPPWRPLASRSSPAHLWRCLRASVLRDPHGRGEGRMVFTDPPYNVPIRGHVSGLGAVKHEEFAMASGEMDADPVHRVPPVVALPDGRPRA